MSTPVPQNTATFTVSEVLVATGGSSSAEASLQVRGVCTDTREEVGGKVFVALRGERFDGHDYVAKAMERGARLVIVDEKWARTSTVAKDEATGERAALVIVPDTLRALGDLARAHREKWGGKVCAVVGSAGKTTTRSVIASLLQEARPGRVHATVGNLNNRIGVPMILLGLDSSHDFAVVELGTNQPGEVLELSRIAQPDVAVLTLIDLEHTEGLGGMDGVEQEESSVFRHLRPGGTKIGFGEDERVYRSLHAAPRAGVVTYGFESERDVCILQCEFMSDTICRIRLRTERGEMNVESPLVGRPGALAVAAGVGAAHALLGEDLSSERCGRALGRAGEPGRNQIRPLAGHRYVIDDTYNSNPASVRISVATGQELAARTGGRLWLVLGEMLELGALSESSHREMGKMAASSGAAGLFFVQGDARFAHEEALKITENARFFPDAGAVADALAALLEPQDVALVKASRGVQAERVVEGLATFHYPPDSALSSTAVGDESAPPT